MCARGRTKLRCLVTGCAGFIGSALTDRLLADGHEVVGFDNFSTGQERFLANARRFSAFRLIRGDLLDPSALAGSMDGCAMVFHLAANADVRFGARHPDRDLEQNTLGTRNVLGAMRERGVARIAFASSGAVYGESPVIPTPEDGPFPIQTSLYGASKVAAEALIAAYCAAFGFQAHIFRFVSILGERYTHGHVRDFLHQLRNDPTRLRVLGDGNQRKSYLDVRDCIDAVVLAVARADERVNVFNVGTDGHCAVRESAAWICDALGLAPAISYTGGERGWTGDSPCIQLDTRRIRALGWHPRLGIRQAIIGTLDYLRANPWILEARP
jgi:UDP-glucose 4-epimerase